MHTHLVNEGLDSPTRADDIELPQEKARGKRKSSVGVKKRHFWTEQEVTWLLQGVDKHGVGKWAKILDDYPFSETRTSVHLKDKYRNLIILQHKQAEQHAKRSGITVEQQEAEDQMEGINDIPDEHEEGEREKEKEKEAEHDTAHAKAKANTSSVVAKASETHKKRKRNEMAESD